MSATGDLPQPSQASSHFPLEPISGSTLFELEAARREELGRKGMLRTGCKEIDEQVLVHGFERGCVVGISAEEMDTGLLIALQTIAHHLVFSPEAKRTQPRAAIITTLATPVILPTLRDVIRSQVQVKLGVGSAGIDAQVRQCLHSIIVSRVFDVEGLWEVLDEIETPRPASSPPDEDDLPLVVEQPDPESSPLSPPPSSPVTTIPPLRTQRSEKMEILDSEDEGELTLSSSASPLPDSPAAPPAGQQASREYIPPTPLPQVYHREEEAQSNIPDIILMTNFSTLLSTLFTHRDRSSAHTTLQLLSSHLRYLSRASGPLIILLNSTTNSPLAPGNTSNPSDTAVPGQSGKNLADRPLDPALRSIFNPGPPLHTGYGSGGLALSRKNKPAFGLTFSQFLDLHLLCTRLPRSRADAEALYAPTASTGRVRYAWVVEVLLDENGARANGKDGVERKVDREQRWGAVDVKDAARVVDAFEKMDASVRYNTETIRVAAGFGGPRV